MIESLYILMVTTLACSIPGVFIVLRGSSMITDALSHSVLLGIVLAFFITQDLYSPFLFAGAVLFGLVTVYAIQFITKWGGIQEDMAVGLIFPLFFSIAVLLITRFASNTHLDLDLVLMGDVVLAPLHRVTILSFSLPRALLQMGVIAIVNFIFLFVLYKELKVTTFDAEFATLAGISAAVVQFLLMTILSVTTVAAFDVVGAILVISFLVTPATTAHLVAKKLSHMVLWTMFFGLLMSVVGYAMALILDVSMSGMCAVVAGVILFVVWITNEEGPIREVLRRRSNRKQLEEEMILVHLVHHQNESSEVELGWDTIHEHMGWTKERMRTVIDELIQDSDAMSDPDQRVYRITEKGYNRIKESPLVEEISNEV